MACGDCPSGWTNDGEKGCKDVNECLTSNGGCDSKRACANTDGGRTCGNCPSGYTNNGDTACSDVDECATSNGGCDSKRACQNTDGGRTCGDCQSGYSNDGETGCKSSCDTAQQQGRQCEGGNVGISCSNSCTLDIISASYGRSHGAEVCSHSSVSNQ